MEPLAVALEDVKLTVKFNGQLPDPLEETTLRLPVMVMEPEDVVVFTLPLSLIDPSTVKSVVLHDVKDAPKLKVTGLVPWLALPENDAVPPFGQAPLPLMVPDAAGARPGTIPKRGDPWA
jgi:hypothetical protein